MQVHLFQMPMILLHWRDNLYGWQNILERIHLNLDG